MKGRGSQYGLVRETTSPEYSPTVGVITRRPPSWRQDPVAPQPNDKLVELMRAAVTARELGARWITLVAPYLCYMRQDTAFVPGDAVSHAIVGKWLGGLFDRVVTAEPHLHRTRAFDEIIPKR